ncbi:hypothetical protein [Pseudomonas sp. NPDC096950]|uniref:hypothetical protein n=1 Tax=Pseudomonas sp. NPDC096950 TaxID=3364485 RepID=UPI00383ADB8C
MSDGKLGLEEALLAQAQLKEAVLDQFIEIRTFLKNIKNSPIEAELKDRQFKLMQDYMHLQTQGVVLLGASTTQDLEVIKEASQRITDFVYNTKKVEKTIKVITAVVVFIGAAINGSPLGIADAAMTLYDVMNKKIEEEKEKGDEAAVDVSALAASIEPGMKAGGVNRGTPVKPAGNEHKTPKRPPK